MISELKVAHCSECGKVFQKNIRNLCKDCCVELDRQLNLIDRFMLTKPMSSTEEVAAAVHIPANKIRNWIRSGKISTFSFPNLTDACDLCRSPVRGSHICTSCSMRIKSDIIHMNEKDRLFKERQRSAASYRFKS